MSLIGVVRTIVYTTTYTVEAEVPGCIVASIVSRLLKIGRAGIGKGGLDFDSLVGNDTSWSHWAVM